VATAGDVNGDGYSDVVVGANFNPYPSFTGKAYLYLGGGGAGVRAVALGRDGELIDDFRIERSGNVVNVLNAPSPAATSALAIAEHVADLLD